LITVFKRLAKPFRGREAHRYARNQNMQAGLKKQHAARKNRAACYGSVISLC
jgi:hypothetical protein